MDNGYNGFHDNMITALAEQVKLGAIEQARLVALLRDRDAALAQAAHDNSQMKGMLEEQAMSLSTFISLGTKIAAAQGNPGEILRIAEEWIAQLQVAPAPAEAA